MTLKNKFTFSLTESDINTICFALCLLPELEFDLDFAQQSINDTLCKSCIHKIESGDENFSANEFRIIYCALSALDEVIRGEWDFDPDVISKCQQYMFNVNKLLPKFEEILPEDV